MTAKLKPSLKTSFALAALLSTAFGAPAHAGSGFTAGPPGWDYYSYQNILIGATLPLQQSANYGAGVTVATIDTGITKDWVGFGGLNITSSSCLNSACHGTINNSDDNGHGTFVASEIVGGVQFTNGNGMIGVAPLANLNAIKVLDANGSGNSADISNAIVYAVNNGAKVINLSLGPTGSTAAEIGGFYASIASAVNFAASQNAVIVFAGGNSNMAFDNNWYIGTSRGGASNPFTNDALHHILFVGATDSNKAKTSYTNTPGNGGFYTTTGSFFSTKSLWVMADGGGVAGGACVDCIVGAPNVVGANYLMLNAGTSMAAPEVTGAAALLAARWPQLLTNGTITTILRTSATDLGAAGVDNTYGYGFINLAAAFQPLGGLSVITSGGNTVTVTSGGTSALSSGALGSMGKLSAALSNYTAFDGFGRDFQVNLSGLVGSKTSSSPAGQGIAAPKVSAYATRLADGSSLAYASFSNDTNLAADHPQQASDSKSWFVSFSDTQGSTMAAGNGFPAAASFADALWGGESPVSGAAYNLGASSSLINLAQGGMFLSYGNQLGDNTRMAMSWTQTQQNDTGTDWTRQDASSFSAGLSTALTSKWKAGVTFSLLDENAGLLGTTYATNNMLGFGDTHSSVSYGVSSSYDLGGSLNLLVDAAIVRTDGSQGSGLISNVSTVYARSYGAALIRNDTFRKSDHLSLSVRSPLRVYSGAATLATNGVDAFGNPVIGNQRVSLTPTGNELDFAIGYNAPVNDRLSWSATMDARRDADNVSGSNDADFLIGMKLKF